MTNEPIEQSKSRPERGGSSRTNVRMIEGGTCRYGHVLTPDNIFWNKNNNGKSYMRCRLCLANRRLRERGSEELTEVRRNATGKCYRGHLRPVGTNCKQCRRERDLAQKYGLTLADFEALLDSQDGACAICDGDLGTLDARHTHVDHDHTTGAVRGILCHSCNTALGGFKDDPTLLQRALGYVTREI